MTNTDPYKRPEVETGRRSNDVLDRMSGNPSTADFLGCGCLSAILGLATAFATCFGTIELIPVRWLGIGGILAMFVVLPVLGWLVGIGVGAALQSLLRRWTQRRSRKQ